MALMWSFVPGVNFVTAFLFAWWACADYYSYSYELFVGPLPLEGMEEMEELEELEE